MTVDHPLPAHSLLGASAAHRWLNCPGSFALSQQAPPSRASIYAATGTLAHSFIDRILTRAIKTASNPRLLLGMKLDPNVIGSVYQVEGHDIIVDEDFVDGVNLMLPAGASASPPAIEADDTEDEDPFGLPPAGRTGQEALEQGLGIVRSIYNAKHKAEVKEIQTAMGIATFNDVEAKDGHKLLKLAEQAAQKVGMRV